MYVPLPPKSDVEQETLNLMLLFQPCTAYQLAWLASLFLLAMDLLHLPWKGQYGQSSEITHYLQSSYCGCELQRPMDMA